MSADRSRLTFARYLPLRRFLALLLAGSVLAGCLPDTDGPDTSSVKFESGEIVSDGLAISLPVGFEVQSTWENGIGLVESGMVRYPLKISVILVEGVAKDAPEPLAEVKQVAEAVGSGGAEYSFSSGKVVGSCLIYIGGHRQSEDTPDFLVAYAVLEKARVTEAFGC